MKSFFVLLVFTLFAIVNAYCQASPKVKRNNDLTYFDTTINLFGDSSYKLALHYWGLTDFGQYSGDKENATFTVYNSTGGHKKILLSDSLNCLDPMIMFDDFNNDKIKDLMIFHSTGGRANPTYYLYLVDPRNKTLTSIRGFEDIPNPSLDTAENIITGSALYSDKIFFTFYTINNENKLIDLKHGFEEELNDSLTYENAIKQIHKEYGKFSH